MNALPNYLPTNFNNASVGMMSITPVNPFSTTNTLTPSVLGNGYSAGYGYNTGNSTASTKKELEQLYRQGIITEDEYRNKLRALSGFAADTTSSDAVEQDGSIVTFYGEELKAARTSNSGDYAVTKAYSKLATNMVEAAKQALKSGASATTVSQLEEVFAMANKNPILADAFLTEANKTTFSFEGGKQANVLGCYQQILTTLKGSKEASKRTTEIRKNLSENVSVRNESQWSKFNSSYNGDIASIDGNFFVDNKEAVIGGATVATGAAWMLGSTGVKSNLGPALKFLGKWGLPVALIAGGVYYMVNKD